MHNPADIFYAHAATCGQTLDEQNSGKNVARVIKAWGYQLMVKSLTN